jgi:polysaccharide pyruvyl transferase WcaK-like protein
VSKKKIFVIGGYGYRNVGDEGQLSGNLASFYQLMEEVEVVVATPNVSFSKSIHDASKFVEALRSCFFNQHETRRFQITHRNKKSILKFLGNEFYKIRFVLDSLILLIDCFFLKHRVPLSLVNGKTRSLIKELSSSDMLFFSGGGYLTEPTLSRLWDGFLHIMIARLFGVKVVMSGQTIGPINGFVNKKLAMWLFSKCCAISLRDGQKSVECLLSMGLSSDSFDVVCDDATFCSATEEVGSDSSSYVAYQFHYWGATDNNISRAILDRNIEIVNYVISKGINVKLISMTPSDELPLSQLYEEINDKNLELTDFKYDIGYVVGIFKNAKLTITMKHHPIVFSIGQLTPVISLNYSDYYHHKNGGALGLFGLEEFGVDIFSDKKLIFNLIDRLFDNAERNVLIGKLSVELSNKSDKRQKFLSRSFS